MICTENYGKKHDATICSGNDGKINLGTFRKDNLPSRLQSINIDDDLDAGDGCGDDDDDENDFDWGWHVLVKH